jgi:hypothetical protein
LSLAARAGLGANGSNLPPSDSARSALSDFFDPKALKPSSVRGLTVSKLSPLVGDPGEKASRARSAAGPVFGEPGEKESRAPSAAGSDFGGPELKASKPFSVAGSVLDDLALKASKPPSAVGSDLEGLEPNGLKSVGLEGSAPSSGRSGSPPGRTLAEPLTRAVPLAGGLLEPKGPGTVARAALAPGIAEIGRDEPSTRSGTRPEPPGLTGRADPLARPEEPAGGTETDAEPLAEPVGRTRAEPLAEPLF